MVLSIDNVKKIVGRKECKQCGMNLKFSSHASGCPERLKGTYRDPENKPNKESTPPLVEDSTKEY